jgi:hypothetical protein
MEWEAMTGQHDGVDRQVIADGSRGKSSLVKRMASATDGMRPGESLFAYAARRDEVVEAAVKRILAAADGADAFDILDLMRQREVMGARVGYEEPTHDASAVSLEIVAIVLLSRGQRMGGERGEEDKAQRSIETLHEAAAQILHVGNFALLAAADSSPDELARLTVHNKGNVLNVRNRQYPEIHDSINGELFDGDDGMPAELGFTYSDFLAVREGILDLYADDLFGAMEELFEISQAWAEDKSAPQSPEVTGRARRAILDAHVTPGSRASFTVDDIASHTGVNAKNVFAVLNLFSVGFAKQDPVTAVLRFLDGDNAFSSASLIRDDQDNFLQLAIQIGTDHFRQTVELALKGTPGFQPYNERRKTVTESMAIRHLEKVLQVPVTYSELHYFAPKKGTDISALGSDAEKITSIGQDSEADALFIIDDVAICVEVKGSSFSAGAKAGNADLMKRDLEKTIGSATTQAHRLENLIEENGGLWLVDRTWLDLSYIREVRSIAVCLDDLGPLAIGLDALVRGGIITEEKFPWIVSIHDLAVIASVLDRAPEFLLYVRRRTEPATSRRFNAIDEMDLFMLFLNGGLYLEPDPDWVFQQHPMSLAPTLAQRRRFAGQAKSIRVDTHTDPLDEWMERGDTGSEAAKPVFVSVSRVLEIVDFLGDDHKPGWFRFAADLLNLAWETQTSISEGLREIAKSTRTDRLHHSMMMCFAGAWGFPSLFAYTRAPGISVRAALESLDHYLALKKHQLQSDRALGLLVDQDGRIIAIRYSNSLPIADAELDEMVKTMRLVPVERMARAVPPSSKRATKRLRGRKK